MGLPRITTDPQQQQNSNSSCGWSLQVEETAGSLPPSSPRLKRAPQPAKKERAGQNNKRQRPPLHNRVASAARHPHRHVKVR